MSLQRRKNTLVIKNWQRETDQTTRLAQLLLAASTWWVSERRPRKNRNSITWYWKKALLLPTRLSHAHVIVSLTSNQIVRWENIEYPNQNQITGSISRKQTTNWINIYFILSTKKTVTKGDRFGTFIFCVNKNSSYAKISQEVCSLSRRSNLCLIFWSWRRLSSIVRNTFDVDICEVKWWLMKFRFCLNGGRIVKNKRKHG